MTQDEARAKRLVILFAIEPRMEAFMQKRGLLRSMGGPGERDGRPAPVKAVYGVGE